MEQFGVTREVIDKAMAAMVADITPQAEERGITPAVLLAGWKESIQSAYFFGYTSAAAAGKEGAELTKHARLSIVYAFLRSDDPELSEFGKALQDAAGMRAWQEINDETRMLGEHPSFVAYTCTECPVGTEGAVYRENQPDPEGEEHSRWRCGVCTKAADMSHFDLADDEETAFRGDVLGFVKKETSGS
ncbi:hypothetical protein AB0A05_27175 [Streptomyces sp. NPDC046374]|uniref:hypothetical protein n=1 Tax=Streptomyces sp. NPDC046374 TaxID=3154917 RepID=UPI0033F89799